MDEYSSGMDPEVKRYFRKILATFGAGMLWMMVFTTAGFFLKLAYLDRGVRWENVVFYCLLLLTFVLLIRYFFRLWGRRE